MKNIVVIDDISDSQLKEWEHLEINVYSLNFLINDGKNLWVELVDPDPESFFTIWYTSGTTGDPKGVILSHQNFVSKVASFGKTSIKFYSSDVHLSYLPLAHIMERVVFFHSVIANGWKVGYYHGDVLQLFEDLNELKPTIFVSVPRIYMRYYEMMRSRISEFSSLKKSITKVAINTKLMNLSKSAKYTHKFYDLLVFGQFKEYLGGRVRVCMTSSASMARDIVAFLKIAFWCPIIEAYGLTETTGFSNWTSDKELTNGHSGGLIPSYLMKLRDVPELQYTINQIYMFRVIK